MPVALITGAGSGIGAAFARHVAGRGHGLVLVGRDTDRLRSLVAGLRGLGAPEVEVLGADLAVPADRDRVAARLADPARPVDLLVNNAGFGLGRDFADCTPAELTRQIDVHVTALMLLCHAVLPGMRDRGHGGIVNVASTAALLPGRGTTYAGSKAFVLFFSEGLSTSLAGTGVRVQALCPGFVRTEFHQRAGIEMGGIPRWAYVDADLLVRRSLADLRANRVLSTPGVLYRAIATASDLLPRSLIRAAASRVNNQRRT